MEQNKQGLSEDWLSVIIGLFIFLLSLGLFAGVDILGWGIKTNVFMDASKALQPISKAYAGMGGIASLIATYVFLLVVMTVGAGALNADTKRFAIGFTVIFWIAYACWFVGGYAPLAATPDKLKAFGLTWSLNLTHEGGFIIALIDGCRP
jgi:hypothetical protein